MKSAMSFSFCRLAIRGGCDSCRRRVDSWIGRPAPEHAERAQEAYLAYAALRECASVLTRCSAHLLAVNYSVRLGELQRPDCLEGHYAGRAACLRGRCFCGTMYPA